MAKYPSRDRLALLNRGTTAPDLCLPVLYVAADLSRTLSLEACAWSSGLAPAAAGQYVSRGLLVRRPRSSRVYWGRGPSNKKTHFNLAGRRWFFFEQWRLHLETSLEHVRKT